MSVYLARTSQEKKQTFVKSSISIEGRPENNKSKVKLLIFEICMVSIRSVQFKFLQWL